MDINNLQAFLEVAEKKSFSKSAESMKLTQPAVSKRIAALETELAARLFDRVGRSVHLTEAGKVLLPSALKIKSEVARIENDLYGLGKEVGGKLVVGVAEHVCLERLSPVLKAYKANYPDVAIDLQFHTSTDSLDAVESGHLDLCLCTTSDAKSVKKALERFSGVEIWKEQLHVMVESNHPLARLNTVTVQDLSRYPGILPQKHTPIRKSIERIMFSNNVEPIVSMEATDFSTTNSMAAIGIGWACLPRTSADSSLVECNVTDLDLSFSVTLVRNPSRSMSRAGQAFVDTLPVSLL